jgi:hypothetical protein
VGRFETYEVDLSDWSLSLSDANPCIWVQASDLEALSAPNLAQGLRDVVRERGWQNSTVILFVDGKVRPLRPHLPPALPTMVAFDDKQQARIQKADSPTPVTLDILVHQMPRSQLAPYETRMPVTGGRFFGRQREIDQVLRHPNTNYLFIGIRRIGKTSLLKEIKRRMDRIDPPDENQMRRLYVDCTVIGSGEEFLQTLASELDPSELKLLLGRAAQARRYQGLMFDRFASLHGGPVTFLLDELDRLLTIEDRGDLFDVLRAVSVAGKARFIMAGFRRAMEASTNQQLPFLSRAEPVHLGRLGRSVVEHMVLAPMKQLRINFQNQDEIIDRIFRETAGLPNYVQFYCKALLERLDEEDRGSKDTATITEKDIQFIYENPKVRDFVLGTFMSNTKPLERALVYALVARDQGQIGQIFSQRVMDDILKERKLFLKHERLDRACRNLEVAGVFNQVGRDFEFAIPLLQRMLHETRDVDFLFDKTLEEVQDEKVLS